MRKHPLTRHRAKTVAKLGAVALWSLVAAGNSGAATPLAEADAFRGLLEAKHLNGKPQLARRAANDLYEQLPEGAPLRAQLAREGFEAETNTAPDPAELAYATGLKNEFYCKDVGLVMAEGKHADGSVSRLLLVSNNRKVAPGSYALVENGSQWVYELSDSFRAPIRSEVWQTYGQANAFDLFEVRRKGEGAFDQGSWKAEWGPGSTHSDISVTGDDLEPVRSLFMAMQYALWGSYRLGLDVTFKEGTRDRVRSFAKGKRSGRFALLADRVVAEHLPVVAFDDADGGAHSYQDCFRVELKLRGDGAAQ